MDEEISFNPPVAHIEKWDVAPEPIPPWLDPQTEVTVEAADRPGPRGPFVVASMAACLALGCDPMQAAGVVANSINETGWGRSYRAYNLGGVKIRRAYADAYRAAHGGQCPPWSRAPGNRSSGDPPWCYYRGYPSLKAFFEEWLLTFAPRPGASSTSRYRATGARFWAAKPWFAQLVDAGYKGDRTKQNPGPAIREHDSLVITALRMWAQSKVGVGVDGVWGPRSRAALQRWQEEHGLTGSGALDDATVAALAGSAAVPFAAPTPSGVAVDEGWPDWAPARCAGETRDDAAPREAPDELDRLLDALARRSPEERRRVAGRVQGLLSVEPPAVAGAALAAPDGVAFEAAAVARSAPVEEVDDHTRADIERLLGGVGAMPADDRAELEAGLRRALAQADRAGADPLGFSDAVSHEDEYFLALLRTARSGDGGGARDDVPVSFDLAGTQRFETFDARWASAFIEMMRAEPVPFPTFGRAGEGPVVRIADGARLALAGDWGTGNASSLAIAAHMAALGVDHTVHLGDVYYAGTPEEVRWRFLDRWPAGKDPEHPCFALNSNHEMYAGGRGYFECTLKDPRFKGQQGVSYFALENDDWTLVAFDSAYHGRRWKLFQDGALDPTQAAFIRATVRRARAAGRRVIGLCHHHGIGTDGDLVQPWWDSVIDAFEGGPDGWYFGHEHAAVAYRPVTTATGREVRARCVGHGGIPYAPIRRLAHGVDFEWCEAELAGDQEERRRALNGFLVLELKSRTATETWVDENGRERWRAEW